MRSLVGLPAACCNWSLLEYALHRFVLHRGHLGPIMRELQQRSHLAHHQEPKNPNLILVHPLATLPVSAALFGLFLLALGNFFPVLLLLVGTWLGFLYYEWVHYSVHVRTSESFFLTPHRCRQFSHHFIDDGSCFGVTSHLWDWVFSTLGRYHQDRQVGVRIMLTDSVQPRFQSRIRTERLHLRPDSLLQSRRISRQLLCISFLSGLVFLAPSYRLTLYKSVD